MLIWIVTQNDATICGWNKFAMLFNVKCPLTSWNAPTARWSVGRIRNRTAKTRNGATPSHAKEVGAARAARIREGGAVSIDNGVIHSGRRSGPRQGGPDPSNMTGRL